MALPLKQRDFDGEQERVLSLSLQQLRQPENARLTRPFTVEELETEDRKNDEPWGLSSDILFEKDTVTLSQGSHGADVWSRQYRYQRRGGCWFLIEVYEGGR